ncbi:two-component response regulator 24-like [Apium graveolens]|uniref:two-component response regulator 24-like n=1 Tax=Apium graveolens TaxID=4045 RepID=UPI003D7AEB01
MTSQIGSSNVKKIITCKMTTKKDAKALIVDDDSMAHTLHKHLLSRFGFKTFTAENGKQAIELFRSGEHFDLITMDFQMPVMDGIEATKTLRDMGVDSKILGVSASDKSAVMELFIEAGVDHFFTKPLTLDKLARFFKNI